MLKERYLERYADVLIWGLKTARRERFRKGNVILIQYDHAALRLAEILYDKIIAAGMNPVQRMGLTVAMERSFFSGPTAATRFSGPRREGILRDLNGRIFLHAPDSLTHLKDSIPPGSARRSSPANRCATSSKNASRRGPTAGPSAPCRRRNWRGRPAPRRSSTPADHPGLLSRPEDPVGGWEESGNRRRPSSSG